MKTNPVAMNLPNPSIIRLGLDPESYCINRLISLPGINKIPYKQDVVGKPNGEQPNSVSIIKSRPWNREWPFSTGLTETEFPDLFYAEFYEYQNGMKEDSFCLFFFDTSVLELELHLFSGFSLSKANRKLSIRHYWMHYQKDRK